MSSEADPADMSPEQGVYSNLSKDIRVVEGPTLNVCAVLMEVARSIDEDSASGKASSFLRDAGWDSIKGTLVADRASTVERWKAIRTVIAACDYMQGRYSTILPHT